MAQVLVTMSEHRTETSVKREVRSALGNIYYDLSGEFLPSHLKNADFAVVALIFAAMRAGRDLHVAGRVSPSLLRSLEEFQEAWALWSNGVLRPVKVSADEEVELPAASANSGVFAASGGVDSTFSLVRHFAGLVGRRTVRPNVAAMVHGFDIPLSNDAAFDIARAGVKSVTDRLGIPLTTIRTNWREVCGNWEWEFGAGLMSVLHQFSADVGGGVLGADEDYAHVSLPWGSNPITNPMLGSRSFEIHTEGGGFGRTDRVAAIASHSMDLAAALRVCWQGEVTGVNCGRCEKCTRTALNFLAAGFEPVAFDRRPTVSQIATIRVNNNVQLDFLKDILATSDRLGTDGYWKAPLKAAVATSPFTMKARHVPRVVRNAVRSLSRSRQAVSILLSS